MYYTPSYITGRPFDEALTCVPALALSGVHRVYGSVVALAPVTLVLEEGAVLAVALLQLGDVQGAERHAARVLDERPDQAEALLVAGLARLADGRADGEAALRRFLKVAPEAHPGLSMARAALRGEPSQR